MPRFLSSRKVSFACCGNSWHNSFSSSSILKSFPPPLSVFLPIALGHLSHVDRRMNRGLFESPKAFIPLVIYYNSGTLHFQLGQDIYGIKVGEVLTRGRQPQRVSARSLFRFWAVRELGNSVASLAVRLERSLAGVGYLYKGERPVLRRMVINLFSDILNNLRASLLSLLSRYAFCDSSESIHGLMDLGLILNRATIKPLPIRPE